MLLALCFLGLFSAALGSGGGGTAVVSTTVLTGLDASKLTYLDHDKALDFFGVTTANYAISVTGSTASKLYAAVQPHSGEVCARISYSDLSAINAGTPIEDFECGGKLVFSSGLRKPFIMSAAYTQQANFYISVFAVTTNVSLDVAWASEDPGVYYASTDLSHVWWNKSYQYVFLDRTLLIILIFMAIFFELLHTAVHNCIKHRSRKAPFNMKIWNQINAEFMVLGFIAFLVWVIERAGGLESLVHSWHSIPEEAADMLHLVEDVHMRLFISMILYFIVMVWVVWNASWYMHKWAETEQDLKLGVNTANLSRVPREYLNLRKKFMKYIKKETLSDPITGKKVRKAQFGNFNFAAYLNKTLEHVLMEMVKVHIPSWFGTGVMTMTVAVIVRYVPGISNYGCFWVMMGNELFILFILIGLAGFVEYTYKRAVTGDTWATGCLAKSAMCANETVLARFIQVCSFYGCYTLIYFASSADARIYFNSALSTIYPEKHVSDRTLTLGPFLGVYIAAFVLVNGVIIPLILPRFNTVFRMPPFLDAAEKREIIRVIYGQYHTAFFPRMFKKHHKKELLADKSMLYDHKHGVIHKVRHFFASSSDSYSADDVDRQRHPDDAEEDNLAVELYVGADEETNLEEEESSSSE